MSSNGSFYYVFLVFFYLMQPSRATSSMILGVIYDTPTIESCHDPKVAYVNDFVIRFVSAASPGAHYVEYFTWMKVRSELSL